MVVLGASDKPSIYHRGYITHTGDIFSYAACSHGAPPSYHRGDSICPGQSHTQPRQLCAGNTPHEDPQHERAGRAECSRKYLRSFDNCFDCSSAGATADHLPKHTLWLFGRAITPPYLSHPKAHAVAVRTCYHTPFYHPPSFITPPNTPCGCSDALSHPLFHHTPFGAPASCTLSPGVHKITPPPQDTTPGDNTFKAKNVSPGGCYLVSYTVCTRS